MKNNVTRQGSLVLMVLIMMTALVVVAHSVIRSSAYLTLLAKEREKS